MLSPEQKAQYESIRQTALVDLESIEEDIAAELAKVKKRLLELQEEKKAVKQVLDGAAARLGLPAASPPRDLTLSDLSQLDTN